jgi:hypothetical protein
MPNDGGLWGPLQKLLRGCFRVSVTAGFYECAQKILFGVCVSWVCAQSTAEKTNGIFVIAFFEFRYAGWLVLGLGEEVSTDYTDYADYAERLEVLV